MGVFTPTTAATNAPHATHRLRSPTRMPFTHGSFRVVPLQAGADNLLLRGVWLKNLYLGHVLEESTPDQATSLASDAAPRFAPHHRFIVDDARGEVRCAFEGDAVLVRSPLSTDADIPRDSRQVLAFSAEALEGTLIALFGSLPRGPALRFDDAVDAASEHGRSIVRHIRVALDDVAQCDSLIHRPLALRAFEEFLIAGLLLTYPHNYSTQLQRAAPVATSASVRRAIGFMEAHLTSQVTLRDVVAASGVSRRTLFEGFRSATGRSPMRYLRDARLREVRRVLLDATRDERIATIASHWSFDHLSRFAEQYRQRFGETPSATRRRARGRT